MELATSFQYLSPATRLYAGMDALGNLHREARRIGSQRAFVVCSHTVAHSTNLLQRTREILDGLYVGVYDGAVRESSVPTVEAGVAAALAAHPDLIVAVGGGSAVVTARAITILMAEEGTVHDLCTKYLPGQPPVVKRLMKPKLPNMLVLTTPTTAADRGGAAVMDNKPPHRLELYDPKTRPTTMILDGEALLTAPLSLYLDTSLTTFTGLVESLQSPSLNPFSYTDLRQAFELSVTYLPQLVARPDDGEVRIQLCSAAILANRASQSTYGFGGRGRTTGLGRQLRYQYPHIGQGDAGCVMAVPNMRLNRDVNLEGQARLADTLGVKREGMSDVKSAEAATLAITDFIHSLGVPTRLRDLQVNQADFQTMAERDAAEPAFGEGDRRITAVEELVKILQEAW